MINASRYKIIIIVSYTDAKHESFHGAADVVYYLGLGFNKVNKYFKFPRGQNDESEHGHMDGHDTDRPVHLMENGHEDMMESGHDDMMESGHDDMIHSGHKDIGEHGSEHSGHGGHAMHYLYSAQLNHMSYKMTSRPLLTQYCEIPKGDFCEIRANSMQTFPTICRQEYCSCTQMINITLGQVRIVLIVRWYSDDVILLCLTPTRGNCF